MITEEGGAAPFPCANDYLSEEDHRQALQCFARDQPSAHLPTAAAQHSHLRGIVLGLLHAELTVTSTFLDELINARDVPALPHHLTADRLKEHRLHIDGQIQRIRAYLGHLWCPTEGDKKRRSSTTDLSPQQISSETTAISAAITLFWGVEKQIRPAIQPFLDRHKAEEYKLAAAVRRH